jgi:hypothetical protein
MKYFYWLCLVIFTTQIVSAQPSKAIGEKILTKDEIALQEERIKINQLLLDGTKKLHQLNLESVGSFKRFSAFSDERLQEILKTYKAQLSNLKTSPAWDLAREATQRGTKINYTHGSSLLDRLNHKKKSLTTSIAAAEKESLQRHHTQVEVKQKTKAILQETQQLDLALSSTKESNKQASQKIAQQTKTPSLDDFLSQNTTKQTGTNSFEIQTKNNLQGVANQAGEILIPFKNWEIKEFKQGIAQVKIKIDQKASCTTNHYIGAFKEGFVGQDGHFIEKPKITFGFAGFNLNFNPIRLKLVKRSNTQRSSEEIAAAKQRSAKKNSLKTESCKEAFLAWKQQIINQN